MAVLNVNPTRMELKRLKNRLKTAQRGHKLLKDKTDEMIRRFIVIARENKRLRREIEKELGGALENFMRARAMTAPQIIDEAVMMPSRKISLECGKKTVMGVAVPDISLGDDNNSELYPYSFLTVTDELDNSVKTLNLLLAKLIELAEVEKSCNLLADEIEKNKRRVNALENIMIPQMEETIKYITMKLDENERASLVRLMKVKDIIAH
ncbi:MAG: V-type ATP synthase subunit D [Clostridia bacterium]|nr:V-type ATP synthase subunit D [Clostridia bacterium]